MKAIVIGTGNPRAASTTHGGRPGASCARRHWRGGVVEMGWSCIERLRGGSASLDPSGGDRSGTREPRIGHATGCWEGAFSFVGSLVKRGDRKVNELAAQERSVRETTISSPLPQSREARPTSGTTVETVNTMNTLASETSIRTTYSELMRTTKLEVMQLVNHPPARAKLVRVADLQRVPLQKAEWECALLTSAEWRTAMSKAFTSTEAETCAATIEALHGAWPKWASHAPAEFRRLAHVLQNRKEILFLTGAQRTDRVEKRDRLQAAIELAGQMHGTPGHTANRVALAEALLDHPEAHFTFGVDAAKKAQIVEAARWMNLADRDLPVETAAARRKLTPEERAQHIEPRMAKSARLYMEMALGAESNAHLIGQTRQKEGTRPIAAQLLDLVDRLAALSAKPFFRDGGQVNVEKVFAAVQKGAADDGLAFNAPLLAAVRAWAEAGGLDRTLQSVRTEDHYLR